VPAFDIHVAVNPSGKPELRFSFRSWNSGVGPFEMIAGEVAQGRQNVYQRIYNDDDTFADTLAGNFEWHQAHNHFHFDDYALYVLPAIEGNSQRSSQKTSFCLMDTTEMDLTLPGAPSVAQYVSCGNFFQGISVGWGDTYGWHLAGQEISLKNLQDGDYRLETTVDPEDRILESDETDNESCVLLHISVSTQTVDILNASGCGPAPPDADGDGLPDASDNCPNVQNTAAFPDSEGWAPQQDDDLDDIGNACDLVIPPQFIPRALQGSNYNHQLIEWRGTPPFTWTMTSGFLPADLILGSDGVISGNVIAGGVTADFTVEVMDSTGDTATRALQIKSKIPNCYSCHSASAF
jgi:hypothetical protein